MIKIINENSSINDKFELTSETINFKGKVLHRIKSLKDFGYIKKGVLGGFVEKESNLDSEGNCWIYNDAKVFENARVYGSAKISENAKVDLDAIIRGNAEVSDYALVRDNAKVFGNALVSGDAKVFDNAKILNGSVIKGHSKVYGDNVVVNTIMDDK